MDSVHFDKTAQLLIQPGFLEGITGEEMSNRLEMAAQSLVGPISRFTPVQTGTLKRSIISELVTPLMSRVMTPVKYGVFVEEGTQAHPVNAAGIGSLTLWAKRKFGLNDKAARSAAYAIANKIRKQGTKGAKMFEQGFEYGRAAVMRILEELPNAVIERLNP